MLLYCRAPRAEGAPSRGAAPDEDHFFAARPRDVQRRGAKEDPLLQPSTGQVARIALLERARTAEDLLFEIGRFSAGPSPH